MSLCRWEWKTITVFVGVASVLGVVMWKTVTQHGPSPVITTSDGPIQGNLRYSRDGKKYWEFLGIPFAEPPVNHLKYSPPKAVKPWEQLKRVVKHPPACLQYDLILTGRVTGELDCLYLNVFVNVEHGNNGSKPVIVYIYGGGLTWGAANIYHPDYFMDQDVILVVMNYRLGPYGFLNIETKDSPSKNVGMLDQLMSLQWVQRNIAAFGGDKDRVTLMGESAGGVSTHLHVLSPLSKGLFQKAIVQSACALASWAFTANPEKNAKNIAKRLGCTSDSTESVMKCFQESNSREVLKLMTSMLNPLAPKNMFHYTIDEKLLPEAPANLLKIGKFPKIPVMFAVNPGEGGVRSARFDGRLDLIEKLDKDWFKLIGNLMLIDTPVSHSKASRIREEYFQNNKFTEDVPTFLKNLTDMMGDAGWFQPTHTSAILHAKSGAPTYLYLYNYTSKIYPGMYTSFKALNIDDWLPAEVKHLWATLVDSFSEFVLGNEGPYRYGAAHAEDIYQLWNANGVTKWFSGFDYDFSKAFVKTLVDFASDKRNL